MKKKYIANIQKKVIKTIARLQLIEKYDVVLIGVSGGKDSMVLLDILGRKKVLFPFQFTLKAIHVETDLDLYKMDVDFIARLCNELDVEFIKEQISFSPDNSGEKSTCFLCSWNRRKKLFDMTRELKCNKLAMGHHMNDAVETLLMNMMYHGSISSLPHKLSMFGGRIHLIRPLLELTESQINDYALESEFPGSLKDCPFADITKRKAMKDLIKEMEQIHPLAVKNIFRSAGKIFPEYLPENRKK